ncbi:acyltransferase family protein [Micromonospora sp.]|uniref:acyltransferase family protein n=1 Tax=Micromonospora sp. TaxID=1876 RepID=UPI003B3BC249
MVATRAGASSRPGVGGLKEFAPTARPGSVAVQFAPRANSVNALRLALAGLVLLSHTLTLAGGREPLGELTGGVVDLGTVAVDGFFALSGFLIARSFVTSPSVGRFLWRRALRILPGFWVCLVVSVVVILPVAHLLEYGTLVGYPLTGPDSVLGYLVTNAGLYIDQFTVRGLYDGSAVNGSLYTLFYEFACYLGVAVAGVLGLVHRRRAVMLAVGAVLTAVAAADVLTAGAFTGDSVVRWLFLRLGLMFVAGVVLYQWADRIPLRGAGAGAAAALLAGALAAASAFGQDPQSRAAYLALAPAAVAYLILYLGARPGLRRVGARRDLSYGLYIYAWPVQVTLLLVGAAQWPVVVYLTTATVISLGMAWLSWIAVEQPALGLKSWTPSLLTRKEDGRASTRSAAPTERRRISSRRVPD